MIVHDLLRLRSRMQLYSTVSKMLMISFQTILHTVHLKYLLHLLMLLRVSCNLLLVDLYVNLLDFLVQA